MRNEPDALESDILPSTLEPTLALADGVLEVAMQYLLATHESPKAHTDIRNARAAPQRGYAITDDGTQLLMPEPGRGSVSMSG